MFDAFPYCPVNRRKSIFYDSTAERGRSRKRALMSAAFHKHAANKLACSHALVGWCAITPTRLVGLRGPDHVQQLANGVAGRQFKEVWQAIRPLRAGTSTKVLSRIKPASFMSAEPGKPTVDLAQRTLCFK